MMMLKKDRLNKLKNKNIEDYNSFNIGKSKNKFLFGILSLLNKLIIDRDIDDNYIEDLNAMIGIYLDDVEFINKDEYNYVYYTMTLFIETYIVLAEEYKLDFVKNNFLKLKNYKGAESIFNS